MIFLSPSDTFKLVLALKKVFVPPLFEYIQKNISFYLSVKVFIPFSIII